MQLTLTQEQIELLADLDQMGSMESLKYCVKGKELASFQTKAVAFGYITQSCVFSLDTGLGKTLIAAGLINIIKKVKPQWKWIFICQCSNLATTYAKLKEALYSCSIVYCDSTENRILNTFFTQKAASADVIVLSYEAITCPSVETFLFTNRHVFKGAFLDESQLISNLASHTSKLISAIMDSCVYRFALTATPLRINPDQVVNQVYMVDRHMFEGESMDTFMNKFKIWEDARVVGYRHLNTLQQLLSPRVFSYTRRELGIKGNYTPIADLVDTYGRYNDVPKADQLRVIKSDPKGPAMRELVDMVTYYKNQGKRGLIYANRNVVKTAVRDVLASRGISTDILDGYNTNTQQKKDAVHKAFLANKYDVLITNITTGKDLPCDYIIFYEQTFDYKQMVGRGERGLSGRDMDIVFILCSDTYEIQFFYNNVYQRGILLEELCSKDLSELKQVVMQIEDQLGPDFLELYHDLNEEGGD